MLPQSLEAATERMMRPESIAREEAVFGDDFVDHYGGTRQHEVRLWNEAVTNWEGASSSHAQLGHARGLICLSHSGEISRVGVRGTCGVRCTARLATIFY